MSPLHSQTRRGFTLIEVLIATAVLVALGALVLPGLIGRVREWTFDSTCREIESVLALARADAQREGRALEVGSDVGADGRVRIVVRAIAEDPGAPKTRALLPDGFSVVAARPDPNDRGAADAAGVGGRGDARVEPGPVTVAIFFPDGTAGAAACYLIGKGGDAAEIRTNGWTGIGTVSPLTNPEPPGLAEDEEGRESAAPSLTDDAESPADGGEGTP